MHYLLFYEVVEDYETRRAPFRKGRLDLVRAAHERGELVLAGALADPPDGAVLLFQGDSPEPAPAARLTGPPSTPGSRRRQCRRATSCR